MGFTFKGARWSENAIKVRLCQSNYLQILIAIKLIIKTHGKTDLKAMRICYQKIGWFWQIHQFVQSLVF